MWRFILQGLKLEERAGWRGNPIDAGQFGEGIAAEDRSGTIEAVVAIVFQSTQVDLWSCPRPIADYLRLAAHLLHNLESLPLQQHPGPAVMHSNGLSLILEQCTEVPQVFRGVIEIQDPHGAGKVGLL